MSYQEKKTIVSMVTGVPVLVAYCIYVFLKYQSGAADINDLSSWAVSILVFIGIGVGIAIITQIIFHIAVAAGGQIKRQISLELAKSKKGTARSESALAEEPDCSEFENEDEMDKLIGLKTMRIGYVISSIGILAGIVMLAVKLPPPYMLHTLFIACGIGSLSEGIAQLHYYRRGISNAKI
jgi:hypothetical protein